MSMKNFFLTGVLAIILVGVPFWYVYTVLYPQYQDNLMYLGLGGIAVIAFMAFMAKVAVNRKVK